MKEAVVLAGGFGTRLRSEVSDVPKPMAPVANQPFLHYVLSHLSKQGYTKVVLAVGYMYEKIEAYFGLDYLGMKIVYSIENEPLGTGGAVGFAADCIESESFALLNGDTLFDIDLNTLGETLHGSNKEICMGLRQMDSPDRYGTVNLSGDMVTAFNEKQMGLITGVINAGVYVLNKSALSRFKPGEVYSFEKDILEVAVQEGKIAGCVFNNYFIDIGIPEDYKKANQDFERLEY